MGQIARSPEIPGVLLLIAFLVFCRLAGSAWLARVESFLRSSMAGLTAADLTPAVVMALFRSTALTTGALLLPPLAFLAVAGVAGNLVQGPPTFTLKPLLPNPQRFDVARNLLRVVSLRQGVELLKIVVKVGLYAAVTLTAVRQALLRGIPRPGAAGSLQALLDLGGTMIARVAMLAVALAILDYLFRRYDHLRSLRMSKQEVRDERRDLEVHPLVRQRIRSRQMALSRSRMMADVPKATVVVTNPTHVAVALRYAPEEGGVPRVLAKGRHLLAERIKAMALLHGVPVVEDAPLARALYRMVPVGRVIPGALFRAVAEVLVLVMTSRRTVPAAARRAPEATP
jgi:flagellar biosynthetic protein FlhB